MLSAYMTRYNAFIKSLSNWFLASSALEHNSKDDVQSSSGWSDTASMSDAQGFLVRLAQIDLFACIQEGWPLMGSD